jgi:hypothetical protein
VEEKIRNKPAVSSRVSAKHFSIARSHAAEPVKNSGITIQIRLKNPVSPKLLSRKNTEYWLSATD